MNGNKIRSEGVDEMRAIVPNTSDKGVGFVRSFGDFNNWIVGVNKGIDDKMEGDYGEVGIEHPPLEVMLTSDLEMRRVLIVKRENRPVVTSVHQLSVWGDQGFS